MNVTEMVFGVVGGLALFLFGMEMLSDGLKSAAGDRLRSMLGKVTRFRLMGLLTGAGVTCLIQSSSATTVIVVGLINAGLLTLSQAISVILGANIGTTVTAWVVAAMAGFEALKISTYALPFIGVGFAFNTFGRRIRTKTIGQILLGLGLLFVGLSFMKEGFGDLGDKEHSPLINVLQFIGDRPILAVLAGAVFTMLIQSSSASIAMVIVVATRGGFGDDLHESLRIAIPFVLGDNIGTTITAQIASLKTSIVGKRAAMAHTLFNVLGVLLILPLVYMGLYTQFIELITPVAAPIGVHIAVAHSVFNVTAALVALPFIGVLERLILRILPMRKKDMEFQPVTLEEHLLDTPELAMQQVHSEIVRMIRTAKSALDQAVTALSTNNHGVLKDVQRKEEATDIFQAEITRYLVALSQRGLKPEIAGRLPVLLHNVNDIERIGDHAMNIAEIAARKIEKKYTFGPAAEKELARMRTEVGHMFDNVLLAMANDDHNAAAKALENEGAINELDHQFRRNHVRRLSEGACHALSGLVFVDYLHNMEKIGDHLTNVAQGILGGGQWSTHVAQMQESENDDATPDGNYQSDSNSDSPVPTETE